MVERILQDKLVLESLGKIEYDIIDNNKALINITVFIDEVKYE